jgi:SAM-dependent methyltransferase
MDLTAKQSEQLIQFIDQWLADKQGILELETTFGVDGIVDSNKFLQIAQRLRSKKFTSTPQEDYMNIITPNHIRFSIYGLGILQSYCKDNTLQGKDFTAMIKDRAFSASNLDLPEYDIRFKVRREIDLSQDDPRVLELIKTWDGQNKAFRLIRRWSFFHTGVRIDLSMVRQTPTEIGRRDYSWAKTFLEKNVLNEVPRYEVEVELLRGPETDTREKALQCLIRAVGEVQRAIQKNSLLIRNSVSAEVRKEYNAMTGTERFRGVGPVTLLLENMSSVIDSSIPNVRTGYNVTDKADGLRAMGFVNKEGELYLVDQSLNVYRTGLKNPKCANSMVDGEWVTTSKFGHAINHYLIFDIYYHMEGKDVSGLPFALFKNGFLDVEGDSRYNKMNDWFKNWREGGEVVAKGVTDTTRLMVAMKHFEFAAENSDSIFKQKCSAILDMNRIYHTDGLILTSNSQPLPSQAGKRFIHQFKWKPAKDNTVDFMVYFEKDPSFPTMDKTTTSIHPETKSTIQYKTMRLYVGGEKIQANENPRDTILMEMPITAEKEDTVRYQPILFTPADFSDTMANICHREVITDPDTLEEYVVTEDTKEPITHRSIVEMRYEPAREQGWRWVPSRIRHDKTERLLRALARGGPNIKYSGMMNDEEVANSVWNSIHDPITESMIRTGHEAPTEEEMKAFTISVSGEISKKYYERKAPKQNLALVKGLQKFHNTYIKDNILIRSALKQVPNARLRSILDVACGKAGDLNKWIFNGARYVVGIDSAGENITNSSDGAYKRYIQALRQFGGRVPKATFIIGNSSRSILDGSAGANEEEADMLRTIFGKYPSKGAVPKYVEHHMAGVLRPGVDIVSCMFALHYFFENKEMLDGFLKNIADTVKVGGFFIGCCFDGNRVFNLLRSVEMGHLRTGMEGDVPIWTLKKGYDQEELTHDETSIGLPIDVEFISIGSAHREYLVSFDYFKSRMSEIGFRLLNDAELKEMGLHASTNTFDVSYGMLESSQQSDAAKKKYRMTDSVKQFSFLNRWFIFRRGQEVEAKQEMPVAEEMPPIELEEESDEKVGFDESASAVATDSASAQEFSIKGYLNNSTRTFKEGEVFRFGASSAITKDVLGVKTAGGKPDLHVSRWLSLSAPFPIPDPDQTRDGQPVMYPTCEHYLAAMRLRFASNKSGTDAANLAINIFSVTGGIHQQFAAVRSKEKVVSETARDYELLLEEATKVRQVVSKKGEILNKSGVVFDDAQWDTIKVEFIKNALQYRLNHDDRFNTIVEAARDRGKYMIYSTAPSNSSNQAKAAALDLGATRDLASGLIKGENKVGRILMKLANFPF